MKKSYHTPDSLYTHIPKKRCIACQQEKEVTEFHRMGNGYRPRCKQCRKEWDSKPLIITQPPLFLFERVCTKCGQEKDIKEFSIGESHSYGYQTHCKQCTNEHMQAYYEENKEVRQDYDRNRRDKEQRNANWRRHYRERYALDPDYLKMKKAISERWRKENPLKYREYCLRRNALKKETATERVDFDAILDTYGFYCYICEQNILLDQKMDFDHVIPLKPRSGEPQGTHTVDNIRPTHDVCNRRKSNKPFEALTSYERRGPTQGVRETDIFSLRIALTKS